LWIPDFSNIALYVLTKTQEISRNSFFTFPPTQKKIDPCPESIPFSTLSLNMAKGNEIQTKIDLQAVASNKRGII
jgi:hypothetical protein